jgi:hypothetical protein
MAKKKERLPEFLHYVEVDGGDVMKCTDICSNWLKCHAYISKLLANRHSLGILERLMLVEHLRNPAPRTDILLRLHGRYNVLRYEVERAELGAA